MTLDILLKVGLVCKYTFMISTTLGVLIFNVLSDQDINISYFI